MTQEEIKFYDSHRSVPEGKHQILSFEEDGYAHLGNTVHPDSLFWCYVRDLLPKQK